MSNYLTENLRTVALVGHGSCGKTSLIEAMLYRTGMISELGSIERGNTMCDNDALEKQVQHSIRLAVAHCRHLIHWVETIVCTERGIDIPGLESTLDTHTDTETVCR